MGSRSESSEEDPARRAWSAMCDLVLDNERRREVSEALGLTFGRIRALRRIARSPMTMGELAANLGIDAPYATLVVDELERQGLVERRPHPTDRRAKLVAPTDHGATTARSRRRRSSVAPLPVSPRYRDQTSRHWPASSTPPHREVPNEDRARSPGGHPSGSERCPTRSADPPS